MPLAPLIARNHEFAASDATAALPSIPFVPNQLAFVVTCLDPRTDPANFLGLAIGDAIVLRNLGGRVTPATLEQIAYVSYLVETKVPDGPYFEIAVIHHDDCGTGFLADAPLRADFAAKTGADADALAELPVLDPARTVAHDVDLLVHAPQLWSRFAVSGWTYDTHAGLLTQVAPPTPALGH
jgi:carbonic anhydrase